MIRSGGAVLKVENTSAEPAKGSELSPSPAQYTVHLLGTGLYSLVIMISDALEVEVRLEGYTVLYTGGPSVHVSLIEVIDASVNCPSSVDSENTEGSGSGGKVKFVEVRMLIETLPTQGASSDSGGERDAGAIVTLGIYSDKKQ